MSGITFISSPTN